MPDNDTTKQQKKKPNLVAPALIGTGLGLGGLAIALGSRNSKGIKEGAKKLTNNIDTSVVNQPLRTINKQKYRLSKAQKVPSNSVVKTEAILPTKSSYRTPNPRTNKKARIETKKPTTTSTSSTTNTNPISSTLEEQSLSTASPKIIQKSKKSNFWNIKESPTVAGLKKLGRQFREGLEYSLTGSNASQRANLERKITTVPQSTTGPVKKIAKGDAPKLPAPTPKANVSLNKVEVTAPKKQRKTQKGTPIEDPTLVNRRNERSAKRKRNVEKVLRNKAEKLGLAPEDLPTSVEEIKKVVKARKKKIPTSQFVKGKAKGIPGRSQKEYREYFRTNRDNKDPRVYIRPVIDAGNTGYRTPGLPTPFSLYTITDFMKENTDNSVGKTLLVGGGLAAGAVGLAALGKKFMTKKIPLRPKQLAPNSTISASTNSTRTVRGKVRKPKPITMKAELITEEPNRLKMLPPSKSTYSNFFLLSDF